MEGHTIHAGKVTLEDTSMPVIHVCQHIPSTIESTWCSLVVQLVFPATRNCLEYTQERNSFHCFFVYLHAYTSPELNIPHTLHLYADVQARLHIY